MVFSWRLVLRCRVVTRRVRRVRRRLRIFERRLKAILPASTNMATPSRRASAKRSLRSRADEAAGGSGGEAIRAFQRAGYEFDVQHGSHVILRRTEAPHRRLSVPSHKEIAKGTLRALIREAGLAADEFARLL